MAQDFQQRSQQYLSSIDAEITRLQQLREQVAGVTNNSTPEDAAPKNARKGMSEEGRRRVAEAQKKRWAKLKNEARAAAKPVKKSAKPVKAKVAKKTAARKGAARTSVTSAAATSTDAG